MCCCCCCSDCILVLVALLFPPLPVWIKRGICSVDSLINILLTILGYLPGLIHSFYIIAKYPLHDKLIIIDEEQGQFYTRDPRNVRVVKVNHRHRHDHQHHHADSPSPVPPPPPPQVYPSYGAVEPPAYSPIDNRPSGK